MTGDRTFDYLSIVPPVDPPGNTAHFLQELNMTVVATLKKGPGKPAYFADIMLENIATIHGCPVWKSDEGSYYLKMPANRSEKGNYYQTIELEESLQAVAQAAVVRAIASLNPLVLPEGRSSVPAPDDF